MKRNVMMWATMALLAGMVGSAGADDGRWKVVKPGVMVDTFAEVQWTQRDNLGDVNWEQAKAHCAGLKLDGGGWQLPTMTELSQIHSGAQGNKVPCGGDTQCHAPKGFYLTGRFFWSSEPGTGSAEAWRFNLDDGGRVSDDVSYSGDRRALCVRRGS